MAGQSAVAVTTGAHPWRSYMIIIEFCGPAAGQLHGRVARLVELLRFIAEALSHTVPDRGKLDVDFDKDLDAWICPISRVEVLASTCDLLVKITMPHDAEIAGEREATEAKISQWIDERLHRVKVRTLIMLYH